MLHSHVKEFCFIFNQVFSLLFRGMGYSWQHKTLITVLLEVTFFKSDRKYIQLFLFSCPFPLLATVCPRYLKFLTFMFFTH